MSHAEKINFVIDATTSNNEFSALWAWSRAIKAAGGLFKSCGNGTTKVTTGVAADDLWGGNADPLADTYASVQAQLDSRAAWWCAELPSVVKLGIGAATVGTFKRGEIVAQSGSGATGEILGGVINAAGNLGWVVIMPQTGTFNGTGQITGGESGATVTATSYTLFRQQIVLAKNTTVTSGWVFWQQLTDAEIAASSNTALFSDLAANAANCSATVCPGNSSSGSNRFPSYAIPIVGTPEGSGQPFFGISSGLGKVHTFVPNMTPSAGVSADGTATVAIWDTTFNIYRFLSLQRLDDGEPGDASPFAFFGVTSESATSATAGRAAATTAAIATSNAFLSQLGNGAGIPAKGYCARGTGTMGTAPDAFTPFICSTEAQVNSSGTQAQSPNAASAPVVRNHPDQGVTPVYPIEHVQLTSVVTGLTMNKGKARHLATVPSAVINSTVDVGKWLVIVANNSTSNPALAIGPLSGVTAPLTV
jgi:hypothetical protein